MGMNLLYLLYTNIIISRSFLAVWISSTRELDYQFDWSELIFFLRASEGRFGGLVSRA
jgi:hypothetical protein